MYNFFPLRKLKDAFLIEGEELKHLNVRRIRPGERIGVIWEGHIYLCELESVNRKEALCRILSKLETEEPKVYLKLIQAVPVELRTLDTIVQKATEIGVKELIPLITERSFRKEKVLEQKRERWERLIKEAMKQAGRPQPMTIGKVTHLSELTPDCELNIVLDNFYRGINIGTLNIRNVKSVCIVVGPEGGFSVNEGETLREKGFIPVRLRPYVLRSETAAAVGAGIIINLADS